MYSGSISVTQVLILVLGPSVVSFLVWVLYDLSLRRKRSRENRKHG